MGLYPVRSKIFVDLDEDARAITTAATMLAGVAARNPGSEDVYILFFNELHSNVELGATDPIGFLWVPADGWNDRSWPHPLEAFTALSVAVALHLDGTGTPATDIEAEIDYCQGVI